MDVKLILSRIRFLGGACASSPGLRRQWQCSVLANQLTAARSRAAFTAPGLALLVFVLLDLVLLDLVLLDLALLDFTVVALVLLAGFDAAALAAPLAPVDSCLAADTEGSRGLPSLSRLTSVLHSG